MASATLDGNLITDWPSFHAQCKAVLGFPDFYAGTIDAWVDCLSYLRDDDGMSKFRLKPNEVLEIVVTGADTLRAAVPDLLEEVSYCVAGINERYEDYGEAHALKLTLK